MPRYAVSDIHGCAKTFAALLQRIGFGREDELFLLGDYIDRGPDSRGVLHHIWQLQGEGYRVVCLRGNHEQMLLDALREGRPAWDYLPHRRERKQTVHWMEYLPFYYETPGYLLVHAGLNFEIDDPLADEEAMLWIRGWEDTLNSDWLGDRVLLYGHTPRPATLVREEIGEMQLTRRACLDSGCALPHPEMGYLTALNLDSGEVFFEAWVG
ncbi:serine/threonine protein phosphatase 1 [Lewinella marina]|uniref:Serine/threonine protein phosphatase n=1 Tax=Neolewinella marina TaxID=438751 RepID=A0A2G0CGL4_9BACT|nr:metallophosphoesterase family protein [Neolewinella marina]NJB86409.1 serine/threonine protein phosphatase 1 [Neolewinella marina]PHK99125.1 serine/threonine protein phosphatase [Neolewinella marina]